jgi:hypothetical protein
VRLKATWPEGARKGGVAAVSMSRRRRDGLLVAAVVIFALAFGIAALLVRGRQTQQAALHLDRAAVSPETPAVSGRYAAWTDRSGSGSTQGVYLYDSATGTTKRITPANVQCSQPAIAGGSVVYVDYRNADGDLYRYDIASGTTSAFVVAIGRQSAPSADGDWVVWQDDRTGFGPRIRAKRLSGGGEISVPSGHPSAVQQRPRVAGGFVVWEEYDASSLGGANPDIYGYDLTRQRLEPIAVSKGIHLLPATDGRYVAWCEPRGKTLDIKVWDRTNASTLTPPAAVTERTTPAVMGGSVYWVERFAQGTFDVYSWRPGGRPVSAETTQAMASRVEVRVGNGSRLWLEYRGTRWYVRADLAGKEPAARTASVASPALRDLSAAPHAGPQVAVHPPIAPRPLLVQDVIAPSPPASPIATLNGTSAVTVDWRPSTDNVGVVGYDVYRSAVPITPANLGSASKVASVTAPPATFPTAANEAAVQYTLYYAVVARDAGGNTALSANTLPDPHGTAAVGASVETCQRCHLNQSLAGPNPATHTACYSCHGNTAATRLYGANSPFDAQAEWWDDTATPLPPGGSRHRNQYMTDTARECDACHTPHRKPFDPVPADSYTMLLRTQVTTATSGQSGYRYNTAASPVGNAFCFDCHGTDLTPITLVGGSTAYLNAGGDHQTGWAASAHGSKVATPSTDPGIQCEACHDKHGSNAGRLLGRYDPVTGTNRIGSTTITANDNSVCLACHTAASAGYPVYSRDASGFPVSGTWPGSAVFNVPYNAGSQSGSMHATRTVVWPGTAYAGGDCKNCHRMHGPSDRYAILRDTDASGVPGAEPYTSSSFDFCFNCHDGTPGFDMRPYYPVAAGGQGTGAQTGHRTISAGTLTAGSALPCYDCHNPHGSGSAYGLMVVTQTSATSTIVNGDVSGEIVMTPGRPAANVRQFCFSCHTTADNASGWNGGAYVGITPGAKVEGIDRVSTASRLRLPSVTGHNSTDTQACYDCHGSDYSGSSSSNVHNPGAGVSNGGVACYTCHSQFKETMDASGTARTSWYHHVLGTGGYTGDFAPGPTGAFPSALNPAAQTVYCVSCHTDHNFFNSSRGANLRQGIGLPGSATTNTDFYASSPYGICVSCHAVSMNRDNVNQKPANAASKTPAIAGPDFAASAHRYSVPTSFSGAVFNAACVKCHDDELPSSFQTGPFKFSLHYSAESRLLAALGTTIPASGMTEEAFCYRCHSGSGTSDAYGAAAMTTTSKSLLTEFNATYRHPIAVTSGVHRSDEDLRTAPRHVECEDCHSPHAARKGTHTQGSSAGGPAIYGIGGVVPAFGASNFSTPTSFAATSNAGAPTDYEAYLCFKCHTSYTTLPTSGGSGGYGDTDLAREFDPNNQAGHSVLGLTTTWPKTTFGSNTWSFPTTSAAFTTSVIANMGPNYKMTCSDCHTYDGSGARGPHGSSSKYLLRAGGTTEWYTTSLSGWSTSFLCGKCHVSGGNNVHTRSNHSSYTCERCHIRVPHGWKRPRFLVRQGTDAAPYVTTQSNSLAAVTLANHTPTGWGQSDCQAGCYGGHRTISSPWP